MMATAKTERPEDVRARKAAAACRELGGQAGRQKATSLIHLVGSEDLAALMAATHRAEAWLRLKRG